MQKIVYIDKEELKNFFNSSNSIHIGVAYEWQGEDVIHIHLNKLTHSYGVETNVLFCKNKVEQLSNKNYSFIVVATSIEGDVNAEVFQEINKEILVHKVNYIPSREELYSRSKGLLEINVLETKRVMIIGLGSFGSQIAIELAKAGVGEFTLFDFDRVELHNIARHTATIKDLGRLKTDVIEESIKGKNPYAKVYKYPVNINHYLNLMGEEVTKADLVICATDNNESRFNLSTVLVNKKKVGIFGRAVTRAEGGDVFIYRIGGPCYCCLIGNDWFIQAQEEITNEVSARRDGRIAAYVSEQDADAMVQVGLSADIEPICNMMIKLALVELSRGRESGISSLESEFVYDYYMWANRRERRHANWAPMPGAGAKPTIMRWYGAYIPKNNQCCLCSEKEIQLDGGEDILAEYVDILGDMDTTGLVVEE